MKRELKLNFGELRLVRDRVTEFQDALADIDNAAAYFDEVLGEQESVAVEALMGRHREMEEEIRYFQDILSRLGTLLENYISDMESCIKPKDENQMMLVDRNDIWWNMKQIGENLSYAEDVASGMKLDYYSGMDTTPSPPHIYEGMSPEDESAAWDRYRRQLQESLNRKANYNTLKGFCSGTAGTAKTSLEELYDSLEEIYKEHVVEFENTDDDYRKKAGEVYDACTSAEERRWDAVVKTAKFLHDIDEGATAAVIDFVSGILGLAFMLLKIDLALRVAVVTVPFGTTPQWVKDTGKEAVEGVLGIAQILKNPGRALAALGQKATDTVEEKGIPYALSYAVTDFAIGRLVDMGIGKLRGLDKADDLSKISTKIDDVVDAADDVADVTKVVNKLDDVADAAKAVEKIDDAVDVAKAVEKIDDVTDVAKAVDKINDVEKVADDIENVTKAVEKAGDVAGVGGLEGDSITSFRDLMTPEELARYDTYWNNVADDMLKQDINGYRQAVLNGDITKTTGGKINSKVITAAIDTDTGDIYYGISGMNNNPTRNVTNSQMQEILNSVDGTMTNYPLENCGEFNAINNALNNGVDIKALRVYSIERVAGNYKEPCINCKNLYGDLVYFTE